MGVDILGTWGRARQFLRSTIRIQVAVAFTVLIAAIATFLFFLFSAKVQNDAVDAALTRAQTIVDLTSSSMAFPLAMNDDRAISQVITTTVKSPDIVYIVVRNSGGDVVNSIYLDRAQRAGFTEVGTGMQIAPSRDLIRVMKPIKYIGRDLGDVFIGISLDSVNNEIASFTRVIAITSIAIFLIGLIGVVGMSWVVSQPVEHMVRTVEAIRAGDLSRRADTATTGDISYLAKSFNAMIDGIQERTTALEHEIQQRRSAEKKIREQAALIEISPDATIVCNLKGQIQFWNRGAERLYGMPASAVIGRDGWGILVGAHPLRQEEVGRALVSKGEWGGEITYAKEDGSQSIVHSRWLLVNDTLENASSIMIINTDITEKKKLEGQLLRAEWMQSIGTLAGGIAHDLNNVLSPILLAIQALKRRATDEKGIGLLDTVETSAKRGAAIIKQILSFARGFDGERSVVQLKHLVGEFQSFVKQTFPPAIECKVEQEKNLWMVSGDLTQLYQVLMNLSVNARDAMPRGGLLTISLSNVVLDEHYASLHVDAKPGPYVQLEVKDTGNGIPAEVQKKMFDPFFTTKDFGKGTGLGLSTVLGIVKSHGGFLNVYSEPGQGTSFKVYLPALDVPSEPKTNTIQQTDLPAGQGQVVLVVDDEPAIREVERAALEANGYRVLAVNDGTEALSVYAKDGVNIHLVITDVMMPFMDGISTIRALKQLNPRLKVIVASGMVDAEKIREIKSLGNYPFLQKPFSTEKLLLTIDAVLNTN